MTTRTRTLVVALAVLAALTGCSASGDGGSDAALSVEDSGGMAADMAPEAAPAPEGAEGAAGRTLGEDAQQVVQTARATLTAQDPVTAAREVVVLVGRLDGRVDARYERSASGDDPGSATLTLRVPSSAMATLSDDLGKIAEVREFLVETENVTAAALDLDARITATELSVERMADLLGRASSNSDIIEAERALTERQANLERLRSERARLADRVALSTVDVEIFAPEEAPEVLRQEPQTFLDGLETGWAAFVSFVRGLLLVVGVLLPWLVLAGLVGGGFALARRHRRARQGGVRRDLTSEPSAPGPSAPGPSAPEPSTTP